MAYVAAKGGEEAISASIKYFFKFISDDPLIFLIDKIMSEGALYTEELARHCLQICGSDPLVAGNYLRAQRTAYKRVGYAELTSLEQFRILRRISSAFKDIPYGQILGPTNDYILKILNGTWNQTIQDDPKIKTTQLVQVENVPSGVEVVRQMGLLIPLEAKETKPFDITRKHPQPPYPRSAALQIMARGETGGMLLLAYTSMRGYGDVHPTIGDLRIGFLGVYFKHPLTEKKVKIGEIRATSCEVMGVSKTKNTLKFTSGYGFCFGFNETKAISMAILDNALNFPAYTVGERSIASNPEIVLEHIDSIESLGFCNHYKLPHYVTFMADLNVMKTNPTQKDTSNENL